MPDYNYFCPEKHQTERHASMMAVPKWVKCGDCGRRANLGMNFNLDAFVRNRAMNDKTKGQFRWTFDKKTRERMSTTGDVEKAFDDFHKRYPHLPRPGEMRGDPLPSVNIRDARANHGEFD